MEETRVHNGHTFLKEASDPVGENEPKEKARPPINAAHFRQTGADVRLKEKPIKTTEDREATHETHDPYQVVHYDPEDLGSLLVEVGLVVFEDGGHILEPVIILGL